MPFAVACHHKDIECPWNIDRDISVIFNWENAPAANPEGMALYFFPASEGGRIWRFDIAGKEGGTVNLPIGKYRMLAFNNDTRNIDFTGAASYFTFTATSPSLGEDLRRMPDMLWSGHTSEIDVTACGVKYLLPDGAWKECVKGLVRCSPGPCIINYTVVVKDVENISGVASVTARLSGLHSECRLENIDPSGSPCSIPFQMHVDGASSITGALRGFGTDYSQPNVLTLFITLTDGSAITLTRDVTEQILNNPDQRNVTIIINGLSIPSEGIPDTPVGGGDIDVGVVGWTVIEINLSTDIM